MKPNSLEKKLAKQLVDQDVNVFLHSCLVGGGIQASRIAGLLCRYRQRLQRMAARRQKT